jgi:O-succinylbenzoic acid--CoA ligase
MTAGLTGSVPDWLRQRTQLSPERVALEADGARFTYRQLDDAVDAMTGGLIESGVKSGDIIALLAQNGAPFAKAVHAVARAGAVLMPLNLRLTSGELAWQLEDAGVHRVLHDAACRDVALVLREHVIPFELIDIEAIPARPGVLVGRANAPLFDLAALHSVLYTSGTTGRPKGAMLTYGNHLWAATASALNLGLQANDRWLACLPLFHVGGLSILVRSVIYGTTAVVHQRFDPAQVNAAIDQEGITIISVVANMLQRMLDERKDRPYPTSLRCVLLGGGPAPEPLLRRCAETGVPVAQTYGLTESASQIVTLAPEDVLRRLGSAGKPLFGAELRIVDEDGRECAPDEPGEIVLRGPSISPGYLNHPDATADVIHDGWLHSGDLGRLDNEGYLYVLDRRDDLIVSGGENVYPAEIEAALQSHPDVAEAGVYGVDDERWGKAPVAVVVLREGSTVDAETLLEDCRKRLAAYKMPRRIEFATALPRTASGKLMRNRLSEARKPAG